ncbi:MAG: NmrA family NAD(P)-binding protein [Anaerolineales bacterium]|nr:NmrA family NAD(P)-binding protein [Anaerolineales bacterium]MCW5856222.1 NmrA family NAD(P)-binding protein [Anaerolineales bacterium]
MSHAEVLVTGAAGKTGLAVLRAVARRGKAARALVHRGDQAAPAHQAGAVQVAVGDLLDSAALRSAMQGVRAVYLICPNVHYQETEIGQAAILAAQAAGVEHFVYHSVLLPAVAAMPHHWQKHLVEQSLQASGLPYTSLQPASYMQNVLPYWESIRSGLYRVPHSLEAIFTPVDLEDVAEVAATVLASPVEYTGRVLPLAGPERLSSEQMAAEMAAQLGRPVRAEAQPLADWAAAANGLSDYASHALQRMFAYYDVHGFAGEGTVLQATLGRPPQTFRGFLSRLAN